MISTRFGVAVSVLLALTAVPTVIHSYFGAKASDGLVTSAIGTTLGEFTSKPTERRATWVKQTYNSEDWIERQYTTASGEENVLLFAARSYDLKRLYHHPEIGVLHGTDLEDKGIARLPNLSDAPVRLLASRTGRGVAAYALLYADELVQSPILFQLQTSLRLLFRPRHPMTLFVVYDERSRLGDGPFDLTPAAHILSAAIRSFLAQSPEAS